MSEFMRTVEVDKSPAEWRKNPFAGRTDELERPQADAPEYRYTSPSELRKLQASWDTAEAARVRREQWVADNRAAKAVKDADAQTARDIALRAAQDAQRASALDAIKRRYLSVPGTTPAMWEAEDKDALLRDAARAQALGAGSPAAYANVVANEF